MLTIENLEVAYARVILAVQGVSLKVPERSIVALLGTNGAGKTTTVRAITGFLPVDDAQIRKGELLWKGVSIRDLPPYRVAQRGIVLVPERDKVFQTLSVDDNLRLPMVSRRHADERRVRRVLELFPVLARRRAQTAGLLSGGERQMLAIAQALLCEPEVLLVDELSLGLAPHLVAELVEQLRRLRDELGLSILLVEQDAASALAIADYGYVMEGGRIVYEGTPEKLGEHQDIQEFYLGSGDASRASYRDVKQYRRARRWWG